MGARLVTIPISHFCEKARWALDRAQVEYVEQPHLQFIHLVAARRAGGGRTVPVFVTAAGAVLAESSHIVRWADTQLPLERRLYPVGEVGAAAGALEAWLDEGFGPDGRLWMYHETLPVVQDMAPWALAGIPSWERAFFRAAGRGVDVAMRRYLGIDESTAAAAQGRVQRVFDTVAERLSDGRRFLLGDRFTAADLAFAALAGPDAAADTLRVAAPTARRDARPDDRRGPAPACPSRRHLRRPCISRGARSKPGRIEAGVSATCGAG